MARGRRLGMAIGVAIVMLVWFWPRFAGWTLPLLFVAHIAAGYPLRRVMREETWSIATYLWFFIRLTIAMFGLVGSAGGPRAGFADWFGSRVFSRGPTATGWVVSGLVGPSAFSRAAPGPPVRTAVTT